MKFSKIIGTVLSVLIASLLLYSCADLTASVKDTALGEDEMNDPQAGDKTLAPAYSMMEEIMGNHNELNNLQGVSSIEQIVPYRGGTDWFDGGRFFEMHQHNWTPQHVTIINVWENITQGIGRATLSQKTISDNNGSNALMAEARMLKAVYNFWLLDMWNIAFDNRPENIRTDNVSTVYTDGEAVQYLLSEIEEMESQLPTIDQVGETRVNKSTAMGLKARLILNKAIYEDRYANTHNFAAADMQAVIDYTTQIIDSGTFELERENYFYMFGLENEDHPEFLFAFNQEPETGGRHNMAYFHASRDRRGSLQYPSKTGSDGGAITQDFYDMWEGWRDDPRFFHRFIPDGGSVPDSEFRWNRGIQVGQQYGIVLEEGSGSEWQRDENGDLLILPLVNNARSGNLLNYTREVGLTEDNNHEAGARNLKWDVDPRVPGGQSAVNLPWLRLGEIYLMRAEANARLGNWGLALNDVNELRDARGARQLLASELDSFDELFREYMFEMYAEHWTRTTQIRFDMWEDAWRDKTDTDVNKRVFPIPQEVIDSSQGLVTQNPGY